jgi:hypothetical protein
MTVGEEFTCACGARYVAVRSGPLKLRLRWQRNVFTLPLHVDAVETENREDYDT